MSGLNSLAWHRLQCPLDTFGIARDDGEVGFSRLVRLRAALFPIPQSAKRDVVARGKLLLGQREGAAEGPNARNGTQLPCPRIGEWRVFMVAGGGGFDFRSTQRSQGRSVQGLLGAVRFDADKSAVTTHSGDSSSLAHFLSPGGLR